MTCRLADHCRPGCDGAGNCVCVSRRRGLEDWTIRVGPGGEWLVPVSPDGIEGMRVDAADSRDLAKLRMRPA